jgi:hypothetical protein
MIDHFKFKPSETKEAIIDCFRAGVVPFVQASPGVGKSDTCRQIAEEFGLEYIDIRLSMHTPEDLMGLPMHQRTPDGQLTGKGEFVPFSDLFPVEGDPLPEGKKGWLVNMDEINSANRSLQAASYKIVLDRMVGMKKLHPDVYVVACGNLQSDKAIVNAMSTALQSRFVHIEMTVDKEEWIDWAYKAGIDSRIIAFMEFRPNLLHDFNPDHADRTFPCPRTWAFASKLITGVKDIERKQGILMGTVGRGAAIEFLAFTREYENIPKIQDILKHPEDVPVPKEVSTKFATLGFLIDYSTDQNLDPILTYLKKFPAEERLMYCRSLIRRTPEMRKDPRVSSALMAIMKFLNDDD